MFHVVGDNIKVEIETDSYGFKGGSTKAGAETGIVVEVPEVLHYFGKHNFSFDASFMDTDSLNLIRDYFQRFVGKRVWWEAFQDKGRHMQEGDKEFVILKMTDIIAYSDDPKSNAQIIHDGGFSA